MKIKATLPSAIMSISIFVLYVLPLYEFEKARIPVESIMLGVTLLALFSLVIAKKRINIYTFVFLLLIVACMFYQRSINPLVLLTPFVAINLFDNQFDEEIEMYLKSSVMPVIALVFTFFYSIYYGIADHRFFHIGLYEPNTSGYAAIVLGLIFFKRRKSIGRIIFLWGFLTLSRNYLLAVLMILLLNSEFGKKIVSKLYNKSLFQFSSLLYISSIILAGLGFLLQSRYSLGGIVYETTFLGRLFNFYDISNYFRFTVNYYLIVIITQNPKYLLVGIDVETFRALSYRYANQHNQLYLGNNPHNFFFSYLKLYGLAGIVGIVLTGNLIKEKTDRENYFIVLICALYCIFLSIGANGYWLFLTLGVLTLYRE